MIKYLLYLPINFLFSLVCYLFNPFVILFTKADGNLPACLSWFQTHDHSLFFSEEEVNRMWHSLVNVKPVWLKLYLCRLCWLYRNAGYTFAFNVCGLDLDGDWIITRDTLTANGYYFAYDSSKPWYSRGWCLKTSYVWCKWFYLDTYLGWKQHSMDINGHTMIAMRINPVKVN